MKNLLVLMIISLSITLSIAQDSDFVRARKMLDQIDNGIKYLKTGDVPTYNQLSAKLTDTRQLLESTQSKDHEEYGTLVNRWNASREKLIEIANIWQNQPAQQQNTQQSQQTTTQPKANPAQTQRSASPQNSSQIYQSIISKYQVQNRPDLSIDASPQEAGAWAQQMKHLGTEQIDTDTKTVEAEFAAGRLNSQDRNRFYQWVHNNWKNQIEQQITRVRQAFDSEIEMAIEQADFINNADENDQNRILNIGNDVPYNDKKATLRNGKTFLEKVIAYDEGAGIADSQLREMQRQKITSAETRLEMFKSKAASLNKEIAARPKPQKKPSTSQKLWLDGSQFCEITKKGEVWMSGNYVGFIEANGKIWAHGNRVGSLESNGDVWHNGNHVGTITAKGEVWKRGSQVGLITPKGEVWIGSSSRGTVEGIGDWRRAAIVYYFDFFK
ncbi:MAG: hypothetical protein KDH95_10860 [Calditrichaeota bacterium]|nr:hypothetical protein [Calditrichota bacterium]MCB0268650.1 hypothetical protein [Calditrichota bacterium]MCB9069708.1 hypothetical protein [Calditrichia bacterium]